MSEKQLTVAELMARAAAEGRTDAPRRRRRRSLEDGGVSVAELTGNLPKVDAKPEEPRHTSEPIDAPEEPKPAAAPAKEEAPKQEAAKPETAAKPEKAAVASPAQQEPVQEKAQEKPAKAETAQAAPVVSVVHDDEPIKLTTDSFPAQPAAATKVVKPAPKVEPQEEAKAEPKLESKPAPKVEPKDAEETGVIPVVTEDPKQESVEDTGVIPAVVDKPAVGELETVDEAEDDDERISVVSVLFMALAGVAVGAAIFLGFKELWGSVSHLLVGVLAAVMTLGIVGVVHALRTERDGMSMALAAVTGLALTFGPLLIVGL